MLAAAALMDNENLGMPPLHLKKLAQDQKVL